MKAFQSGRLPAGVDAVRLQIAGALAWAMVVGASLALSPGRALADPPKAPAKNTAPGKMLDQVALDRHAKVQAIETEVAASLRSAQSRLVTAPAEVYHDLSLELDRVRKSKDLETADRARLAAQIRSMMLQASRQANSHSQQKLATMELNAAQHAEAQRMRDITTEQQRAQRVLSQTAADIQSQQYDAATQSAERADRQGRAPMASAAAANQARASNRLDLNTTQQEVRNKAFLATTDSMAKSHILVPDSPGIQYPSAEEWKAKVAARSKYDTMYDNHRVTPAEEKINAALQSISQLECNQMPMADVISYLRDRSGIEIQLDRKGMADTLVEPSTAVTMHVKGIKLKSILKLLCDEFELTYVRRDDMLLITSKERAEQFAEPRVYYVGPEVMDPYEMQLRTQRSMHGFGGF